MSGTCGKIEAKAEITVGKIIEFYIPSTFRKNGKWIPPETHGKVIEFPAEMARPTCSLSVVAEDRPSSREMREKRRPLRSISLGCLHVRRSLDLAHFYDQAPVLHRSERL
jgi:hypothetical protein